MTLRRLLRDERGATFIIAAISMVVLLAFAAIAVDVAASWVERRQDQAAVDVADLSAAQLTAAKLQGQAMADAEAEVRRISAANFGTSDAEWAACTDPGKPAEYDRTVPGYQCVSFNSDLSKIRVRAPVQDVPTYFASVVGVTSIPVSAFAEVSMYFDGGVGGVLPFGMPDSAKNDTELCLKTASQPLPDICDGPDSGNFGPLDFRIYGSAFTTENCNLGGLGQGGGIAQNIATGVDHELGKYVADERRELDGCGVNVLWMPTTGKTETGNVKAQSLDDGFLDGINGHDGRLYRPGSGRSFKGTPVDNTPLWSYFWPAASRAGTPCADTAINDTSTNAKHENMAACLVWWKTNRPSSQLFDPSLADSRRFAWVPLLNQDWPNGSQHVDWIDFRPVFVQTLAADCKNNIGCSIHFDPGEPPIGDQNTNKALGAATALQLGYNMLPDNIKEGAPGQGTIVEYLLIR